MIKLEQMNDETFNKIVLEVHAELMNAPAVERDAFMLAEWSDVSLIDYHHSLGRYIRNNYNLWHFEWEPELIDGIDYSKFHPDNISMEIIKEVWLKGNGRTTSN